MPKPMTPERLRWFRENLRPTFHWNSEQVRELIAEIDRLRASTRSLRYDRCNAILNATVGT